MVESLQTNLDQQLDLLESLTNVVAQEQQLLCSGRIQGWVLQGVTEQKFNIGNLGLFGSDPDNHRDHREYSSALYPYAGFS